MNTRKALGIFTGNDAGDTFLSDPRAAEHFGRRAAERQADILRKQQQPQMSLPHARLAADVAAEANRTSMLNSTAPLVDKFSAYQTAKKYASQTGADGGLRALAQHLRVQWEGDPDGFFSSADLVRFRDHFSKSFGRTAAVDVLSNAIPRAGVGDMPIRRLAQLAAQIRTQADYEATCRHAGLDGGRPDQVRARAYLRALVRRAAEADEGGDVMNVDVNEQQGAQVTGIPAGDGGGVLSGADLHVTQTRARKGQAQCPACEGMGVDAQGGECQACKGSGTSLPSEKQVMTAVLDANVVKIAGYSIFVNDNDRVEIRTPRGASREAPISRLSFVVRDFLKAAQAANFEPSVNAQQDPYVDLDETEGGDVLGKDSASDDKATDAIVPSGKPKQQHPAQSQSGTSVGDKNLGDDSAGKDPVWGNPALSGAHSSDPHSQSGTSFSDRDLGSDHQQDTPGWENPGPIQTSRKARLDDSVFIAGVDPAERYRRARQDRPSARLLEGIGDEQGWLSRRVLAQMEEGGEPDTGKGDEAQTPAISDVAREAARTTVRLRDDVHQIGDGFADRTADSKFIYTFGYDQKIGQPRVSEMQRYVDTCCGGVRAYRVASLSQVSPGVVRAIVIEAQEMPPMFGGGEGGGDGDGDADDPDPEAKREAVRRAMGKVTAADFGNDSAGMASDYEGTVLNKEGAGRFCEKCKVTHREKTKCPRANEGKSRPDESRPENKPRYEEPALPPAGEVRSPYAPKPDVLPTKKNLGEPPAAKPVDQMSNEEAREWSKNRPVKTGPEVDAMAEKLLAHPKAKKIFEMFTPRGTTVDESAKRYIGKNFDNLSAGYAAVKDMPPGSARLNAFVKEVNKNKPKQMHDYTGELEPLLDAFDGKMPPTPAPQKPMFPEDDEQPVPGEQMGLPFEPQKHPKDTGFEASGDEAQDHMTEALLENPKFVDMMAQFAPYAGGSNQTAGERAQSFVRNNIKQITKSMDAVQGMPKDQAFETFVKTMSPNGYYPEEIRPIFDGLVYGGLLKTAASEHFADAPAGWSDTVEQMIKGGAVDDVSSVGAPSGPHEGTQKAIKPVKNVPALKPKGQPSNVQPKQGQLDSYLPGEFNPYDQDPPELAEAPPYCKLCGNNRATDPDEVCSTCKSQGRTGARISEGWGEGGEYKREIDAESAQEVWELHRGLGGEAPDFKALQQLQQQRQQQEAQASTPVEPRPDASGQVRLPEPEPETMNAEQEMPQQVQQQQQPAPQQAARRQGAYGDSPYDADASSGKSTWCEDCGKTFYIKQDANVADVSVCEDCLRKQYDEKSEREQSSGSWGTF